MNKKTIRRKTLAIFTIMILMLHIMPIPTSIAAGTANLSASSVSGAQGDTVLVEVKLDSISGEGLAVMTLDIVYDNTKLELDPTWTNNNVRGALLTGILMDGGSVTINQAFAANTVRIVAIKDVAGDPITVGGVLGTLRFKIKNDATGTAPVTLSVSEFKADVAGTLTDITTSTTAGGVTVNLPPLTSIALSPKTGTTMFTGDTLPNPFTVTYNPTNTGDDKTVAWSSSNLGVATINSTTGDLTAVAPGTTTITANVGGKTDTATVTVSDPALVSITVNNVDGLTAMAVGQTLPLRVIYNPTKAAERTNVVDWESSNPGVATVHPTTGVVTGVTNGSTVITATVRGTGISNTFNLTVNPIVLTGLSLDKTTLTMNRGGSTEQLTAVYTPLNTTERAITWSSSDIAVATVSTTGVVTPVGIGTATITATSDVHPIIKADCAVTVNAPLTGIAFNPSTLLVLNKGASSTALEATIEYTPVDTNSDKSVTWVSGNTLVATVSSTGVVTAVGAGTTEIKAISVLSNSIVATRQVRVDAPLQDITLNHSTYTLQPNGTVNLSVTYDPVDTTDNKGITWTTSNSAVATVSTSGVVTARGLLPNFTTAQTATITATSNANGLIVATCVITVETILVTGVTLNESAITMNKGATRTLVATVNPTTTTEDRTVTWSIPAADSGIATVNSSTGLITAVGPGTTTLTAAVGTWTATCTITVVVPLTGIDLNKTSTTIVKGGTDTLVVTKNPTDTTDTTPVTWTTSNAAVATVSGGVVTAVGGGQAQITATVGSFSKTCIVNVTSPMTGISIPAIYTLLLNQTHTMGITFIPADTTDDRTASWISSDPSIVSVHPTTGLIRAISEGTATISVTVGGFTESCVVTALRSPLGSIAIQQQDITILRGKTENLVVIYTPADTTDDRTVTWTSSNPTIATVDANGKVTGLKAGTVTITAAVSGNAEFPAGFTATTEVTIKEISLTGVNIDKNKFQNTTFTVGQTYKLEVNLEPYNTTDDVIIVWISSDPTIATIDANGLITALKAGTVTFTAYVNGQISDTYVIEIQADLAISATPPAGDINLPIIISLLALSFMVIIVEMRKKVIRMRR